MAIVTTYTQLKRTNHRTTFNWIVVEFFFARLNQMKFEFVSNAIIIGNTCQFVEAGSFLRVRVCGSRFTINKWLIKMIPNWNWMWMWFLRKKIPYIHQFHLSQTQTEYGSWALGTHTVHTPLTLNIAIAIAIIGRFSKLFICGTNDDEQKNEIELRNLIEIARSPHWCRRINTNENVFWFREDLIFFRNNSEKLRTGGADACIRELD